MTTEPVSHAPSDPKTPGPTRLEPTGRDAFNMVATGLATAAALFTFYLVYKKVIIEARKDPKDLEKFVTAAWIFLPPLYFWVDWVFFRDDVQVKDREAIQHTHDLARNIWLGLLLILVYAFFDKVPGG